MYDKTIIKDNFGQHYTIQTRVNPRIRGRLEHKVFQDTYLARQFLQGLQVPHGYWRDLAGDIGLINGPANSDTDIISVISERIATEQIKIYPIKPHHPSSDSLHKQAVRTPDKVYRFLPAAEQLLHNFDVTHFNRLEEAEACLEELNPDDEKLKDLAAELNIAVPPASDRAGVRQAIAESLLAGDTVLKVDTITSATPPAPVEEVLENNSVGTKKADLGPHETEPEEIKRKDIDIQLEDEFEQTLGSHEVLLTGIGFTLKTDMGEEHNGTIENGRIFISQALINSGFELELTDLPAYQEV